MPQPLVKSSGVVQPMLRVALPVLAEQLLRMLVGFSDTILAGRYLGKDELAAMGMMNYLLWFLYTLFGVVAVGATALVARFVGAGQAAMARRVVQQSMVLGLALTVVLMTAGLLWVDRFVSLVQLSGMPARLAAEFLRAMLCILPFVMLEEVGIACLRGAGDTVSGLAAMSVVNVVNVSVAWSLIAGGFQPWPGFSGWDALIAGAVAGNCAGGAIVAALLICGRANLTLRLRRLAVLDGPLARRLLRIGGPGGMDQLVIVMCHLWYVSIINRLGPVATAAHGIGVRIESLAYLPGFAFQVAAATLVGQYLGAGNPRLAARSVLAALFAGGGIMVAAGGVLFAAPEPLIRLLVAADEDQVIRLAASLLPIVALAMPALAVVSILAGALRGAGDTRCLLAITLFGLLAVRIPAANWCAYNEFWIPVVDQTVPGLSLGAAGAWYAMVVDSTVRCLLVLARFFQGGWKRVRV
jgi:putative MATE family efflux protein